MAYPEDPSEEVEIMVHSEPEQESTSRPDIKHRLYISHFLSTWNSRAFEFGAILFVAACFPGTLLPTSAYALARAASAVAFSPAVGRYIDTTDRLKVVRLSILVQRTAVIVSCVGLIVLWSGWASSLTSRSCILVVLSLLGCFEKLASIMNLVSVERDWVVTIAEKDEELLRVLNSQMRRIDLLCKLAGPLAISLLDGLSTKIAIFFVLGSNLATVAIEYFAIVKVYNVMPSLQLTSSSPHPHEDPLHTPAAAPQHPSDQHSPLFNHPENPSPRVQPKTHRNRNRNHNHNLCGLHSLIRSLAFYFRHPVFLPSMALALLYCSVLSFSGQMVTYLLSVGYQSSHIGLMRTVSVVFEISATWISPKIMARLGPTRAGLWGINWQLIWVGLAAAAASLSGAGSHGATASSLAAAGLVGGVIVSRVGLWAFDLCVQMIVQEEVEPENRGRFSTLESSFQNGFELLSYASTLIFSRPDQFKYPVLMSAVAVLVASALYAAFVRQRRGHLLHMPRCLNLKVHHHHHGERGLSHGNSRGWGFAGVDGGRGWERVRQSDEWEEDV
ncbi:hypothetical protein L228DRAFT_245261 [Xylona heveae TC161]|uniref:Solute carrier family 40 member n=1 Tax=Xylona heveae (strain CBS 132557 / TC161) TaxID=1328760 RepID=A0A165I3S7_XYLHT|nr:hypothetical protein L228DRAFT_245261 [Xylona heveae TC161]KZF24339.1 hypothetical protein L228DRAFT_245261 [Xylona heveae TC161]